tara:strand:+ start:9323 stop:9610 length:288 start_codon:yes stop_codon:yes gene_type:complete
MKVELSTATVSGIGKSSGIIGIGTSVLAFFEVNAIGIGALCAFLTLIVYALFNLLNHLKNDTSKENKLRLDKLESDRGSDNKALLEAIQKINKGK